MRRVHIWSVILGLWLLLVLPALAQSGSVRVEDPDNLLGAQANQVREAAQRLADEGAEVIVVAAGPVAGSDASSADQYLSNFLAQNNLAASSRAINPNQVVFYVARDARRTSLLYGSRWKQTLDPVFKSIQDQQMNPRFASGDVAGGMIAGLDAVRTTINPPTSPLVYVLGGALVLGVIALITVPMLQKRRASATALETARERMRTARQAAGAAISDVAGVAEQAQAKAQYDRISYSQTNMERLQSLQAKGTQLFQEAQDLFSTADDQIELKANPTAGDYEAVAAQYERAQNLAQQANSSIGEAEALRAQLDAQGSPSTGPTTRLRE
ncbi:MAG TPA: TPM domain-containing protein [Herpetosiphonaceae bacterium]